MTSFKTILLSFFITLGILIFGGNLFAALYSPVGSNGTPTISSCGTSPSVAGNDMNGQITVGTGVVAACTLNFSATLSAVPKCLLTSNSTAVIVAITSASASAVTLGFGASLPGGQINYFCPIA